MSTEEKSGMLAELAQARAENFKVAGMDPTEEGNEAAIIAVEKEKPASAEEPAPVVKEPEPEPELIKIGDKEFTSQAEAIKYAESLEYEKLVNEAYNQGVKEALQAQASATPQPQEDDQFETRFYTDPKGTLKELKEQAKAEALQAVQAENRKEALWSQFLTEHPDIDRADAEIELRKPENWETIGKMVDTGKAMKLLAQKVRADYQRKADRLKPRTELSNKPSPVVGSGIGTSSGVTPQKKSEGPKSLVEQMKSLRRG